jgi:LmbE family N-acetylglucosaminyl deacetylase
VVSFDASVAVTRADEWASNPRWGDVETFRPAELEAAGELIVFSAHPDDETLGAGGLIALAGLARVATRVIVATGDDPRRRREVVDATAILNPDARVTFLGFPDGELKHFATALADDIDGVLEGANVPHPLVVGTWSGDRHGDHRTLGDTLASVAQRRGVEAMFYPIWLWQWGRPDDVPWSSVQTVPMDEAIRARKNQAIAIFRSQLRAVDAGGVLTEEFVRNAREGREVLIRSSPNGDAVSPTAEPAQNVIDHRAFEHFERLHHDSDDPWSVRTRWYERRKRAVTLASIPREHVRSALEVGCSVGELSAALAERSGRLTAIDASASAVVSASARLAGFPNAVARQLCVPQQWPEGEFDLVVLSEVAYYFRPDVWTAVIERCLSSSSDDGMVLLCHWRALEPDFLQSAEAAHSRFAEVSGMKRSVVHHDESFDLEVFER